MRKAYLPEKLLGDFLQRLAPFGTLHGPTVLEHGVTAFAPLESGRQLALDYRWTQIPPKKYLLPFREQILGYAEGGYTAPAPEIPRVLLFGLHPCDLQGIEYLDRVFLGSLPDPSYAARRERLTLVGISCHPDDYCFCNAQLPGRYDLFLHEVDGGYLVTGGSQRGEAMLHAAAGVLQETELVPFPFCPPGTGMAAQDPELRFSSNPLWEKFAETCVSCGACSACCPTCYCFDVREYPQSADAAERMREWDNCLFKKHGEVAGGGNFRRTRLERLRFRFLHKYYGFSPLQGVAACVGCGRCRKVCPVDIDLREIFQGKRNRRSDEPAT